MIPLHAEAVQYVLTSANVSDGVSDQVVVYDNAGTKIPLSEGDATASLGYFSTSSFNSNPGSVSVASLVGDFVTLATSDFGENPGFDGFFSISNTINDVETNTDVTNGTGRKLFLFIGNNTTLGGSNYVGLVDTGLLVPDVTGGLASYSSTANFSAGGFGADGTSHIIGSTISDNIFSGDGITSDGAFELVLVPEPSAVSILGIGIMALILNRRR